MKRICAILMAFLLSGCGGGSGGGGGSSLPRQPALIPAQALNAPVTHRRDGVQIGGDVRPSRSNLSPAGAHGRVAVSTGRVRDGENAERVTKYLEGHSYIVTTHDGNNEPTTTLELSTFRFKPVMKIRETTPQRYVDDIVRSVQFINTALPYDRRITISPERAPHLMSEYIEDIPDGYIYLGISPQDEWPMQERVGFRTGGAQAGNTSSSYIWVNPEVADNTSRLRKVIVHEMFHAARHAQPPSRE